MEVKLSLRQSFLSLSVFIFHITSYSFISASILLLIKYHWGYASTQYPPPHLKCGVSCHVHTTPGGDGLVWKVGLTVEIKLPFSHFSRVVHETLPQSPLDSWSSTSRPSFFAISSCAISYVMSACFKEDACISAGWWKTYRWLVPNIILRRTTMID